MALESRLCAVNRKRVEAMLAKILSYVHDAVTDDVTYDAAA